MRDTTATAAATMMMVVMAADECRSDASDASNDSDNDNAKRYYNFYIPFISML